MRQINSLKPAIAVALVAALSACTNYPGTTSTVPASTTYPSAPAAIQFGRVTNVELVRTQQQPASAVGAGALVGGVVGGVLGRQVGSGTGRDIATVVGVVGGALVGNAIEKNQVPATVTEIYRVTVQQDNGVARTFDYAAQPNVRIGDRVRVENNQLFR